MAVGEERREVEGEISAVTGAEEETGEELGVFELVCGSADVSNEAPGVSCGGRTVEVGSGGFVPVLTVEERFNVGVIGDVGSDVLVLSVVVCGAISGFTIHSRLQLDHSWLWRHRTRLEEPAFLTYPSTHLWRNVLPISKQPAVTSWMWSLPHLGIGQSQLGSVSEQRVDPSR